MINIDALNDDEKLAALESIHKSIAESKEIQKKKITTNVEMILKALKKIEGDLKQRYDETGKLIANLKNGTDGRDGKEGRDGKDGRAGKDGAMGPRGYDGLPGRNGLDGQDGVSVVDAQIDFDGSLTITLSNGNVINAGEIVNLDLAEKIKVITNGGGTSQFVLDALASLEAQISQITSGLEYQGTWNASTNVPTLASSVGTAGYYYIVATAGSTNLNGVTDWQVGDWAVFNGTVWQKIDQTNLVTSVAGRTGAVVLTTADIGGLGTIATQAASNVAITGGSIAGITDLAIADGGTGQSTAAAAITALTGTQTSGRYLRSDGTNAALAAIVAGDVPTLNQNTTGNAANVTGTVAIANGGTGQTTANAAFNALVPSQTSNSGKYLTTNGTDTSWATNPLGTVTSVGGTGTVNGLTLTGTVTTSGNLTLGGTLSSIANSALTNSSITIGGTAIALGASSNTLANDITINSLTAGRGAGSLSSNSAFGASALTANTTGYNNTGIGKGALSNNLGAYNNTAVGFESGFSHNTGNNNTSVGSQALFGNQTGSENVALGAGALYGNDSGQNNVAIGYEALKQSTIVGNNTSVGHQSLYSSGQAVSAGSLVVGVSYKIWLVGTTNWVSIGAASNTAGVVFTATGVGSGIGTAVINGGANNTALGYLSGYSVTGSSNTLIGYSAGLSITTGSNNTTLGFDSGKGITTGSKNVIIGSYAGIVAPISMTGSNFIVLSDGDANVRGVFDSSGNFGVGTTSPGSRLDVKGTLRLSGSTSGYVGLAPAAAAGSTTYTLPAADGSAGQALTTNGSGVLSFATASGTPGGSNTQVQYNNSGAFGGSANFVFDGTNVGIGTSSPSTKLHVSGVGRFARTTDASQYLNLTLETGNAVYNAVGSINHVWQNAGTEQMRLDTSGNLGLGVTPSAWSFTGVSLDLAGNGSLFGGATLRTAGVYLGSNVYYTISGDAFRYKVSSQEATMYESAIGQHRWYNAPSGTAGNAITFTQAMTLDADGDLGIGTTSPAAKLHVTGSAAGSYGAVIYNTSSTGEGLTIRGGSTSSHNALIVQDYNGSNALLTVQSGGNVGIGSGSPSSKLEVVGANKTNTNEVGTITAFSSDAYAIDKGGSIAFWGKYNSAGGYAAYGRIYGAKQDATDGSFLGYLGFSTSPGGSPVERMRLDSAGNLGLGVTPSAWTTFKAFEFGTANGHSLFGSGGVGGETHLGKNLYYNSGYKYANNDYSTDYKQTNGIHSWHTAASGTAGNAITFTQAMTLDASGNLGVGTTSPAARLDIVGASAGSTVSTFNSNETGTTTSLAVFQRSGGAVAAAIKYNATNSPLTIDFGTTTSHALTFLTANTERARIDSSGNFMVATTSAVTDAKISAVVSGVQAAAFRSDASTVTTIVNLWGNETSGNQIFVRFATDANSERGSITYNRAGGLVAYNVTSDYRAKDITGSVTNSGALIDSIPVYMGTMKGATQERPMFIAHETPAYAHTGVKDAVDADGNPVYQQMDASALIPVMWAEIQSLRKRLADAGI